ncbi:hypothetical protein ACHAXN_001548, partial [Cyclotella atomus]
MLVNYANILLGHHINTHKMIVLVPHDYLSTLKQSTHSLAFKKAIIEPIIGKLGHAAQTLRWLKHLMGHLYTSLAAALGARNQHLLLTSKTFRDLMKMIKDEPTTWEEEQFHLNKTAKEELRIIRTALADPAIQKISPIAHLVDKDPNGTAFGDSCLDSWGGWSTDMKFWWMLEWPQEIRDRTLPMIKPAKDGDLIAINEMEYATSIVNFAA